MSSKKYLLSTGEITSKIEYYFLDLFKLYLTIYPGDIPGASDIGFNFIFTDVKKDEIVSEVKSRVNILIEKLKSKIINEMGSNRVSIVVNELALMDETTVRLILTLNERISEELTIDIYNQ